MDAGWADITWLDQWERETPKIWNEQCFDHSLSSQLCQFFIALCVSENITWHWVRQCVSVVGVGSTGEDWGLKVAQIWRRSDFHFGSFMHEGQITLQNACLHIRGKRQTEASHYFWWETKTLFYAMDSSPCNNTTHCSIIIVAIIGLDGNYRRADSARLETHDSFISSSVEPQLANAKVIYQLITNVSSGRGSTEAWHKSTS